MKRIQNTQCHKQALPRCEVYLDETNPEMVYVKFLKEGKEMYAEYAIIQ